jgi:hypothetical protein
LVAVTWNVYAVPFVKPVTIADEAEDPAATGNPAVDPAYGVTVYPVIALPPLLAGADQLTNACPVAGDPDTDWGAVGAVGAELGVTELDCADAGPVPTIFVAATVNVYAVPFVKPVTVAPVDEPDTTVAVCAAEPIYGVTV